jgi:hypothetical protein
MITLYQCPNWAVASIAELALELQALDLTLNFGCGFDQN